MRMPWGIRPGGARAWRATRPARHARRPVSARVAALRFKLVAIAVAAVAVMACGAFAAGQVRPAAVPAALGAGATQSALPASASTQPAGTLARLPSAKAGPAPSPRRTPRRSRGPRLQAARRPGASSSPARSPSSTATAPGAATTPPPSVTATSQRKGVSALDFAGVSQALAESGVSWWYNWAATPNGTPAPSGVPFVPMIWNAADVTTANLDAARQESGYLLGFNEPDMANQADMSPQQALSLWPQLEATGLILGSPAVSSGAATPGGWLDQFMAGAKADGYRVDFIAVHWYGGDFDTASAVQELESYLQAIYARYHLPIWLTEFALIGYSGSTPIYPAPSQQAAFLTAATAMLDGLPYVQRYAWFSLSSSVGPTGLFEPGPVATTVGQAFEAAR
jgi:hypothetical protein